MAIKRKYFVMGLASVLLMGMVFGAWLLIHTATGGAIITSEGMSFSDNFSVSNYNGVSGYEKIEGIEITNTNGVTPMQLLIDENVVDVADGCDNTGDISVVATYDGTPYNDGDWINISSGTSVLMVKTTIIPHACPQTQSLNVTLQN